MKLSEYKSVYEDASAQVSDITRQMALAGIAIIWIFRQTEPTDKIICPELITPLLFFISTLFLDLSQYIYKTIAWYIFFRTNEKKNKITSDPFLQASTLINKPTWLCFWLKVISLVVGYVLVFIFLFNKMFN
jgi:hypothetical protein